MRVKWIGANFSRALPIVALALRLLADLYLFINTYNIGSELCGEYQQCSD